MGIWKKLFGQGNNQENQEDQDQKPKQKKMEFGKRFFWHAFACGLLVGIVMVICMKKQVDLRCFSEHLNYYDLYYTQVSVSFIIISLVSVLSTVTKTVYWVDISQYKLVEPRHTSFIDFSAYILACLVLSSICLFLKKETAQYIVIPFFVSIFWLAYLAIKMIGSYFGRDAVKAELQKKYKEAKDNNQTEYLRIRQDLLDNTYQAIDAMQSSYVEENLNFLIDNKEYGSYIEVMDYLGVKMPNIFCAFLEKYASSFSQQDDMDKEIIKRYYQMVLSNLVQGIEGNVASNFTETMFSIYLNGRQIQILRTIDDYEDALKRNQKENFKNGSGFGWGKGKPFSYSLEDTQLINFELEKIYDTCLKYEQYSLLCSLLKKFGDGLDKVKPQLQAKYLDSRGVTFVRSSGGMEAK